MRLDVAIKLAVDAHWGQMDKAGQPYILHPLRVMHALRAYNQDAQAVGVLHDVLEDTDVSIETLESKGATPRIIEALCFLTKAKGITYQDYILGCVHSPWSMVVKLADLEDNMSPARLGALPQEQAEYLFTKYNWAHKHLSEQWRHAV